MNKNILNFKYTIHLLCLVVFISFGVFGIVLTQYLTAKVQRSFLSATTFVKENLNQGDILSQSNIPKNSTVSSDVIEATKTNGEAIFVGEGEFVKSVNQKSEKPLYMKKNPVYKSDLGKMVDYPDTPVYIEGVPGIITYSKKGYPHARIITKAQVDDYNLKPNHTFSKDLMLTFDDLIEGLNNETDDLESLYTVKSGYSNSEFGLDLREYKIDGLEIQRAFLSVGFRSDPDSHEINIIGKKSDRYFWFKTPLFSIMSRNDYNESFRDRLASASDDKLGLILEDFLSDPGTKSILDQKANELISKFKFLDTE